MVFGLNLKEEKKIELSGFLAIGKIFEDYFKTGKKIKQKDPDYQDLESFVNSFFSSMIENLENEDKKLEFLKEISPLSLIHFYKIALNIKYRTMRVIELTQEYLQQTFNMKIVVEKYFSSKRRPEEVISFILPPVYDMNYLSLFESLFEIEGEKWMLKGILCLRGKIASCIVKNTVKGQWVFNHNFLKDESAFHKSLSSLVIEAVEYGYTPVSFFYIQDSQITTKEAVTADITSYLNILIKNNKHKKVRINHQSSFKDLVTEQLDSHKVNFIEFIPTQFDREYQSTIISSLMPSAADRRSPSGERNNRPVFKAGSNKGENKPFISPLLAFKIQTDIEKQNFKIPESPADRFFANTPKPIINNQIPKIDPVFPIKPTPIFNPENPKIEHKNENASNAEDKKILMNSGLNQIKNKNSNEVSGSPPSLLNNRPNFNISPSLQTPLAKPPNIEKNSQNVLSDSNQLSKIAISKVNPNNRENLLNKLNNEFKPNLSEAGGKEPFRVPVVNSVDNPNYINSPKLRTSPQLSFQNPPNLNNPPILGKPPSLLNFQNPPNLKNPPDLGTPPPLLNFQNPPNLNNPPDLGSPPPLLNFQNPPNLNNPPDLSKPPPQLLLKNSPPKINYDSYSNNLPQLNNFESPVMQAPLDLSKPPDLGTLPEIPGLNLSEAKYYDEHQIPFINEEANNYDFMSNSSFNPLIHPQINLNDPQNLKGSQKNLNFNFNNNSEAAAKGQFFNFITNEWEQSNLTSSIISGTENSELDGEYQYNRLQTYDLHSSQNILEYYNLKSEINWTCDYCYYTYPPETTICNNCYKQLLCPYCSVKTIYGTPNCSKCGSYITY